MQLQPNQMPQQCSKNKRKIKIKNHRKIIVTKGSYKSYKKNEQAAITKEKTFFFHFQLNKQINLNISTCEMVFSFFFKYFFRFHVFYK